MEVGVAEPAVHLDGQRVARRLVRLERRDHVLGNAVEPAAISGDRLQRDEARLAGDLDVAWLVRLDPEHRRRATTGELAEALPLDARARRREAVVHEQPLGVRRAQQRRRVSVELTAPPERVDRVLRRVDAEERGELAHRASIRDARRDVRPLPRIGALGEEPAELVERRRLGEDSVRVVVDEADRAQDVGERQRVGR